VRLVPGEAFGRYRIEAEIGRGGQAVVYRATQVDLDRQVALKVFDEGYLARAGALERFRREAIAAGRLEHPRIVPVYDAGEFEGRAYIAMRLVPGDTLAERIARGGPLEPAEAVAVLSDIAEAIDFAHARGTVHRDVKPGNILLEPGGASYLSDFGLVRLDDMPGLTRRGDWLGTAEYVSPEQVEGEPGTERSDLYALAAVAFEALTGRPPFVRREPSAVLLAHVREPVPEASAANSGLPVAVDEVLARGLAKAPDERPADARHLVDELRHALGSDVLRPTVVGGAAAPAVAGTGDPWEEALGRFRHGGDGEGREDPPTQAFGDAARRRALAMGRDLMVAAGVALLLLVVGAGLGGWALGHSQADPSGAEERGYAEGERAGRQAGFDAGRAEGVAAGKKVGLRLGKQQGRKAGFAQGRKRGADEGREEGYAEGVSEGRSAALGGLGPGWYVVQVGEDDAGPVVAGSSPVTPDAGQCYTVSGATVLSGPC
jgi:tRNA A-37 threonylcarbamoyl transferase component Bud32